MQHPYAEALMRELSAENSQGSLASTTPGGGRAASGEAPGSGASDGLSLSGGGGGGGTRWGGTS
jgi:hypothetical protein